MRATATWVLIGLTSLSYGQSTLFNEQNVLDNIVALQVKEDPFYDPGLFPTKRYWFRYADPVEDNNVFMTASIAFILRTIQERRQTNNSTINAVIEKASSNFFRYANRNGDVTYNFWQTTGEDIPFPNGNALLTATRNRLPDDYDDTALVELAKNDKNSACRVREKMISYASRIDRDPVKRTPDQYREYNAYETWFADKMTQDYDIAVMSNVLSFVFRNQYELTPTDRETIHLIRQVVNENRHMEEPEAIAPHYRTVPLILYHLARMLSFDHQNEMQDLKSMIIDDIRSVRSQTLSEMEKMLLYTSLYRLGTEPEADISFDRLREEIGSFAYFHFKPTQLFGTLPVMKWQSEALNWVLVLEFLSFSQTSMELSE